MGTLTAAGNRSSFWLFPLMLCCFGCSRRFFFFLPGCYCSIVAKVSVFALAPCLLSSPEWSPWRATLQALFTTTNERRATGSQGELFIGKAKRRWFSHYLLSRRKKAAWLLPCLHQHRTHRWSLEGSLQKCSQILGSAFTFKLYFLFFSESSRFVRQMECFKYDAAPCDRWRRRWRSRVNQQSRSCRQLSSRARTQAMQ